MKMITDECVGCDFCADCGARHTERFYCDRCGDETRLYIFGDEEICRDCLLDEFGTVEGSE